MAERYVPDGSRLLDIGGFDGSFLNLVSHRISRGVCIDPLIEDRVDGKIELIKSCFTERLPFPEDSFDVVTMLAVFEHLSSLREPIVREAYRVLSLHGKIVLTVPDNAVDKILRVLVQMKLVDGMSLEEHDHFPAGDTVRCLSGNGFTLRHHKTFQMGLNNLFVFEK